MLNIKHEIQIDTTLNMLYNYKIENMLHVNIKIAIFMIALNNALNKIK